MKRLATCLAYPMVIKGSNLSLSAALHQRIGPMSIEQAAQVGLLDTLYHDSMNHANHIMRDRFIRVTDRIRLMNGNDVNTSNSSHFDKPALARLVDPKPLGIISSPETSIQNLSNQQVEAVLFVARVFRDMGFLPNLINF
jgi:hypothetical protein